MDFSRRQPQVPNMELSRRQSQAPNVELSGRQSLAPNMELSRRQSSMDNLLLSDEEGLNDSFNSADFDPDPVADFCTKILACTMQIDSSIKKHKSVTKDDRDAVVKFNDEIKTLAETFSVDYKKPQVNRTKIDVDRVVSVIRDTIAKQLSSQLPNITPAMTTEPVPTYASMTRSQTVQPKEKIPITKPALIISSTNEVHSSAETLQKWKQAISFKDTNFSPASVKFVSNNKLRVEFDTETQRDEALRKANSKATVIKAEKSKKLKPMIILKGISEDTPAETLTEILYNQNDCIKNSTDDSSQMELRFQKNNRNPRLYNAVIMTSSKLFRAIMTEEKLNVDHQRVHVEEHVPLLQCYHCLQFGHTRKRCTQESPACSHCSAKTHAYKDCPVKNDQAKNTCLNCVTHNTKYKINKPPPNHSATSNSCPRVIQMLSNVRTRIDYGY